MSQIRVTVWNEFWHEQHNEQIRGVYPDGIHSAIGEGLKVHGFDQVGYATLPEPEHGLTEEVLANTDVLLWWGHMAHDKVSDDVVARVHARVLDGMGLIVLHLSLIHISGGLRVVDHGRVDVYSSQTSTFRLGSSSEKIGRG